MAECGVSRVAPIGKRFGRVTVVSGPVLKKSNSRAVEGRCDCGDVRPYYVSNITKQDCPMCPACREKSRPSKGMYKHPLFNIWKAIIQRCENPNHTWYMRYGGRGIRLCERWSNDFQAFASDMGERPSTKHTIDRIDGNGNYEPDNCRWATPIEQQNNRSDTLKIEWNGKTLSGAEASALSGIDRATIYYRLSNGWSVEKALTTPSTMQSNKGKPRKRRWITHNGQTKHVSEWAKLIGISANGLYARLERGIAIKDALTLPVQSRRR